VRGNTLVVLALLAVPGGAPAATSAVTALRVEGRSDPLGVDVERPRFSWVMTASERGAVQTAYRLAVASTPLKLLAPDVWDSGRVTSADNAQVSYAGPPLSPLTRYHWTVELWDGKGREIVATTPAFFETGFMGRSSSRTQWIGLSPAGDDERRPLVGARWIWVAEAGGARRALFRTAFSIPPEERVVRAELHYAGPGSGEPWDRANSHLIYVNDTPLRAFSSVHTDPRLLIVTPLLRAGVNDLAIAAPYAPGRALLVTLALQLADGRERRIQSDGTWRCRTAPTPTPGEAWRSEAAEQEPWRAVRDLGAFGEAAYTDDPSFRQIDVMAPAAYLRRPFTVAKPIRSARLYVTAAGIYEPYLNGEKVGNEVLAPGWTD
jgi:alpha-L-rhamnosidase